MVVRKIWHGPVPDVKLLTVAEFGTRFDADAAAALAGGGGYDVEVMDVVGIAVPVSLARPSPDRGRFLLIARENDVLAARAFLAEAGVEIAPPAPLDWKGAAITVIVLIGVALLLFVLALLRNA